MHGQNVRIISAEQYWSIAKSKEEWMRSILERLGEIESVKVTGRLKFEGLRAKRDEI